MINKRSEFVKQINFILTEEDKCPDGLVVQTYGAKGYFRCELCQYPANYCVKKESSSNSPFSFCSICEVHRNLLISIGKAKKHPITVGIDLTKGKFDWRSIRKKRQDTWNKIQLMKKFATQSAK